MSSLQYEITSKGSLVHYAEEGSFEIELWISASEGIEYVMSYTRANRDEVYKTWAGVFDLYKCEDNIGNFEEPDEDDENEVEPNEDEINPKYMHGQSKINAQILKRLDKLEANALAQVVMSDIQKRQIGKK